MPLIPLRPLLETVDKYHYAQGAFNVNAVAQAKAAIEVHEMFRSAAILQGADLANGFMGAVQISRMQLWKTRRSVPKILPMPSRNMLRIHLFLLFCIWITVRTLIPVKQPSRAVIHLL